MLKIACLFHKEDAMTAIPVFQNHWGFTTASSRPHLLQTTRFGNCIIVILLSKGCAGMAHIDVASKVESLSELFDQFKTRRIDPKKVTVVLLGGWKEDKLSEGLVKKVISAITNAGFSITENLTLKTVSPSQEEKKQKIDEKFYYHGVIVSAKTQKYSILSKFNQKLDDQNLAKVIERSNQGKLRVLNGEKEENVLTPLTRATLTSKTKK